MRDECEIVSPPFGNVVFVVSGKGGVGKSTVAANLAAILALEGEAVGLLDADLHGPSQSEMFGAFESPRVVQGRIQPPNRHGVRLLSSGMLGAKTKAFAWRGPILRGVLRQFLFDTQWGEIDYFVVDLPPGTGETLMALLEWLAPQCIVAVLTPQDVATADTRRALEMLQQLELPTDVLVENMATFCCPECGTKSRVFPGNGGSALAHEYEIQRVVRLPLLSVYTSSGDVGIPAVMEDTAPRSIRATFSEISSLIKKEGSDE